jgi:hypothetical protein
MIRTVRTSGDGFATSAIGRTSCGIPRVYRARAAIRDARPISIRVSLGMRVRASLLLTTGFSLCLGASRASAQEPAAALSMQRGLHARALLYGSPVLGIGPETQYWPSRVVGGGGLTTGFDIALHANHDVGGRAFLAVTQTEGLLTILAVAYRFHDHVALNAVAPFVEVGVGGGYQSGCWDGDSCGGIGAAFEFSGGGEVGLHRYASLLFGAQILIQTGLPIVSVMIAPTFFLGLRAG